jgi:hypothetical protein
MFPPVLILNAERGLTEAVSVPSGFHPIVRRGLCAPRHSIEQALKWWHRPLKSCHEIFDRLGRDCINMSP